MLLREALFRVSLSPFRIWRSVGGSEPGRNSEFCHRRNSKESPLYLQTSKQIIKEKIARNCGEFLSRREKSSKTMRRWNGNETHVGNGYVPTFNPLNPDNSIGSSSRTNSEYLYEIRAKFLRIYIQTKEENQTPTYKQKIQFLKAEMPERKEMKMDQQFR